MDPRWMTVVFSIFLFLASCVVLEFKHRREVTNLLVQIHKLDKKNKNINAENKEMLHLIKQLGDSTCYLRLEAEQFKTLDLSLKLDEMYVEVAECAAQDRDIMMLQMRNIETASECGL